MEINYGSRSREQRKILLDFLATRKKDDDKLKQLLETAGHGKLGGTFWNSKKGEYHRKKGKDGTKRLYSHFVDTWKSRSKSKNEIVPTLISGAPVDPRLAARRMAVLDFLYTEKRDDNKLEQLLKEAGNCKRSWVWGNPDAYYTNYNTGAEKRRLSGALKRQWTKIVDKDTQKKNSILSYLNAKRRKEDIGPTHVIYLATIHETTQNLDMYRNGKQGWDTFTSVKDAVKSSYPGIYTSWTADVTMRMAHFKDPDSPIYRAMVQQTTPTICLEMFAFSCDEKSTMHRGEAFLLQYCRKWNELYPEDPHQFIISAPECRISNRHTLKAEEYAKERISMFEIVSDAEMQFPPANANEEQVMTLPYKIHGTRVKERWIPDALRGRNEWK